MSFHSFTFLWGLLPVVLVLCWLIPDRCTGWRNGLLLFASVIFYGWGRGWGIVALVGYILVNYGFGILLEKEKQSLRGGKRAGLNTALALMIGFNLAMLCCDRMLASGASIGAGFFTLRGISYTVDVYRGKHRAERNWISLGLYFAFFPYVISGPVESWHEMAEQIVGPRKRNAERTAQGIRRFIIGIAKKALIADALGVVVDQVWGMPPGLVPGGWHWLMMICYSLQLYYDFSGYSDMAIGLGRMFGFNLGENFDRPYLARSIREFWRRWHISLGRWFREYVYIPLGGNRRGKVWAAVNGMIVFLLSGVWHGFEWKYLVWGAWHGMLAVMERGRFGKWLDTKAGRIIGHGYTLMAVTLGWVMFRASGLTEALGIFQVMFTFPVAEVHKPLMLYMGNREWVTLAAAVILCGHGRGLRRAGTSGGILQVNGKEQIRGRIWKGVQIVMLMILLGLCIIALANGTWQGYIYGRF